MSSVRASVRRCLSVLLVRSAIPATAQTTLGTIRGTVFDPQQQVVPGATVVVTDESTSVTREAQTDAQGLFEIPNLRPGTYTVTATLSGFRKAQRTGVVLRAASVVRIDLSLAIGSLEDVVTVTASGTNITIESQAIARGLDEQQLRDLPRNSRDIQDFLTLNPNVVGGFDSIQFLGGRTYGAVVHPGRPAVERRDLRRALQCGAGARRDSGSAGAVELVQRGVRRPCRCHRLHETRREPLSRDRVLRLQLERVERAHLRAGAEQRVARVTPTPTRTTIATG